MNTAFETHEQTARWLETEIIKYVRQFQLARTLEERNEAENRLSELTGRVLIETRALKKLMHGE